VLDKAGGRIGWPEGVEPYTDRGAHPVVRLTGLLAEYLDDPMKPSEDAFERFARKYGWGMRDLEWAKQVKNEMHSGGRLVAITLTDKGRTALSMVCPSAR
jgi:hypothetical protein